MAGITGKDLYLAFGGTVLDTDYRSFGDSREMALVDQAAGSDTARTYLTTLQDGTATATIVIQVGDTATWDALAEGTGGTLEWGEEGSTAGKPSHKVWSIVQSREKTMDYDDLVVADITWQYSQVAGVTDSTY